MLYANKIKLSLAIELEEKQEEKNEEEKGKRRTAIRWTTINHNNDCNHKCKQWATT